MSDNGGPVSALTKDHIVWEGMSLFDFYAAHALHQCIRLTTLGRLCEPEKTAEAACTMAAAMIEARKKFIDC